MQKIINENKIIADKKEKKTKIFLHTINPSPHSDSKGSINCRNIKKVEADLYKIQL